MSVYYEDDAVPVVHGDRVTDPLYGIRFMGQAWDGADIARRTQRGRDSGAQAPAGARGSHDGGDAA